MSTQENGKVRHCEVKVADSIRCRTCKKVYKVGELKIMPGHEIPKMDGSGELWRQILYRCPKCQRVLICDVGNGDLALMLIATEIATGPNLPFD